MKLKDLFIKFISFVGKPANRRGLILKDEDGARTFEIVKTNDEMRRAYGIVYAPDEQDAQGDWTDAGEILKAADDFMRAGRLKAVDENHDFEPKDAFVAESWLIRKGDPLFPDETPGAWAVGIQILDETIWNKLKKGELTGLSMAGTAAKTPENLRKDMDMDEKKFEELIKGITDLTQGLADTAKSLSAAVEAQNAAVAKSAEDAKALREEVTKMIGENQKALIESNKETMKTLAAAIQKGAPSAVPAASPFAGMA